MITSNNSIQIVNGFQPCGCDEDWDQFNEASPQGSIYSCSAFLNCLPVKKDRLFFKQNGVIVASVLIMYSEDVATFSMYQGISLAPINGNIHSRYNQQLKVLTALLEDLTKEYQTLDFSLSHYFDDLRAFQWINYHVPDKGNFQINLNYTGIISLKDEIDFETYLESIRSVRRYEWRQCEKKQFKVYVSNDVKVFLDLYRLTFERQGIELDSLTMNTVRNITESAIEGQFGRLTYCEDLDGNVHSANLILYFKNTCYYEFGASDPKFRSSGASVYLMLHNIKYAFENNFSFFDLVGINSPNRGDFKLSFNAIPKPYFNVKGIFLNN